MNLVNKVLGFFKSEKSQKKQYADSIILDAFGNILLLERSYQDDFGEGKWCLPGGKVEPTDETIDDAAKRELMEETGLNISSLTYLKTISNESSEVHYFIGFLNDLQLIVLDNNEHYRYEFVSFDELDNYDLLLDLKSRLDSFDIEDYFIHNIKESDDKILKDLDHTKLSKAFDKGYISEDDFIIYSNIKNAFGVIQKGFDEGLVEDDIYINALIKSKRYEFVRVVRDGKQFYQYRLVGSNEEQKEPEENMEVGGYFEDEKTGLKVSQYSDKSFLISGNTYKNLDLLRKIKEEVGIGSWNKTLNGWVFPSNAKSKIMSMLAEKMDVSTYEGQVEKDNTIAIKNAIDPGTEVTVGGESGKVIEVGAENGEPVYTVETKEGEKEVTETEIGIPAETNNEKASEEIAETDESLRFKTDKELGGKEEGEKPISEIISESKDNNNVGELKEITTRSGEKIQALDYTNVRMIDIQLVNQETILDKEKPYWVPDINESIFERNKFVFNFVKQDESNVIVALNGYGHIAKRSLTSKNEKSDYAIMPIEQMLAIQDYYTKKKKADIEKDNTDYLNRKLQELKNWDDKKMEYYKPFSYARLSTKQVKKYTKEQWDALSIDEKIAEVPNMKKPVFSKQSTRIQVLGDDKYHAEYFTMYKDFVNHLDTGYTGGRYVDSKQPSVKEWNEVRKIVEYKKADMRLQREENDSTYVKGKETSYGDSNTKDDLLNDFGIKIKAQNGSELKVNQIEQIKANMEKVYNSFGNRSEMSKKFGLKVSHAGDKRMHASKALGVYIPGMHAIGVSADPMMGKFGFTLAHEFAHFMDNYAGTKTGRYYASDDYNSIAGKIATTFRSNMNKVSDSDYINRTCECFARAMEQYHAMKNEGDDVVKYKMNDIPYHEDPNHVSKEKFNTLVKPLIEQFLSENDTLLKSVFNQFGLVDEIEIIEKAEIPKGDPSHGGKLIKVTHVDKTGKKVTKWVSPEDANKEIGNAKSGNHHVEIKHKDYAEKELKNFAKEASESALKEAISNGTDEKLRKIAHEELDRRGKEEAVQEDKEDKNKKDEIKNKKSTKKFDGEEDSTNDFIDDLKDSLDFVGNQSFSGYKSFTINDSGNRIIIRIKNHNPNLSRIKSEFENEDNIVGYINVTAQPDDLKSYGDNGAAKDKDINEYQNEENRFINIKVKDGNSVDDIVNEVNRAISIFKKEK